MSYKSKLEKQIEEFKNKDSIKLSDVQDLNESIYRYNNKLKYVDKLVHIVMLIAIIFVVSILGLFVLNMNKEYILVFTLFSIFNVSFWGIVDEEGMHKLSSELESEIDSYLLFNKLYISDEKFYFMKDIMEDENNIKNYVNSSSFDDNSYFDYILNNVIEGKYVLYGLEDDEEDILYREGKFLSYKEYKKVLNNVERKIELLKGLEDVDNIIKDEIKKGILRDKFREFIGGTK